MFSSLDYITGWLRLLMNQPRKKITHFAPNPVLPCALFSDQGRNSSQVSVVSNYFGYLKNLREQI